MSDNLIESNWVQNSQEIINDPRCKHQNDEDYISALRKIVASREADLDRLRRATALLESLPDEFFIITK